MTRFKQLRRFEAALEGEVITELEWAVAFAKKMLGNMRLKSGVDSWRKRRDLAQKPYEEVTSHRRLTGA